MSGGAWLISFLMAQRLCELCLAQWNTVRLRARGGVEFGATHYPLMIALHATWLLGLWTFGRERDVDPLWLAAFVVLQGARVWVIASLGRRWTTRLIVRPGAELVTSGPYRLFRHPNYLIVVGELAILPLAFNAFAIAVGFSICNGALLLRRSRLERAALDFSSCNALLR